MIITQGPILWGIIPVPFALVMPTIARLSSKSLSWSKSPQLFIVVYVWVKTFTFLAISFPPPKL
jgi:hypothetical protein